MEQVDWHHIAKERFANEIAEALYRHAHANLFDRLIIIAPPKMLGQLRKACHAEVVARIAAEISKELASHRVSEIGKLVAAQRPQLPGGYAIRRPVPKCSGRDRCQGSFMKPLGNISLV